MTRIEKAFFEATISPTLLSLWQRTNQDTLRPKIGVRSAQRLRRLIWSLVVLVPLFWVVVTKLFIVSNGPLSIASETGARIVFAMTALGPVIVGGICIRSFLFHKEAFDSSSRLKDEKTHWFPDAQFVRDARALSVFLAGSARKGEEELQKNAATERLSLAQSIIRSEKRGTGHSYATEEDRERLKGMDRVFTRFGLVQSGWDKLFGEARKLLDAEIQQRSEAKQLSLEELARDMARAEAPDVKTVVRGE